MHLKNIKNKAINLLIHKRKIPLNKKIAKHRISRLPAGSSKNQLKKNFHLRKSLFNIKYLLMHNKILKNKNLAPM